MKGESSMSEAIITRRGGKGGGGVFEVTQEFITANKNWTVPATYDGVFKVVVVGAGGYGGTSTGGGGGGSGWMNNRQFTNLTVNQSIRITIGNVKYGGTGGTTSFGSYLSANGGTSEDWGRGGNGGAGGGAGSSFIYNDRIGGGIGYQFGGGGGSGQSIWSGNKGVRITATDGGNGGAYGGGGGGGAFLIRGGGMSNGGRGGTYGGNGGAANANHLADLSNIIKPYSYKNSEKGTNTIGMDLDYIGNGNQGRYILSQPFGGGGGYGGDGGSTDGVFVYEKYSESAWEGQGGGGGGGYGAKGGTSAWGCGGGGGGYGANGHDASSNGAGGGGGYGIWDYGCGGDCIGNPPKGGVCIISYYRQII